MTKNNLIQYSEKEIAALIKCLQEAGLIFLDRKCEKAGLSDLDAEQRDILRTHLDADYLSINMGRDSEFYAWYFDGNKEVVVRVEDLEVVDDEETIDNLLT